MSFCTTENSPLRQFDIILSSFQQEEGLPFAEALSEEDIDRAFRREDADFGRDDDACFTPAVTLWAFLSQVVFKDEQRSCEAAVMRVVALHLAFGREPPAGGTGAYCKARRKLKWTVLRRLVQLVARRCEEACPGEWLWHGRHVKLVDGSTVTLPDTPQNQAEWPQQTGQRPGLGFPIARMVMLTSLASGMLHDMAIGPYAGKQTGEMALLRQLLDGLGTGDILLADRYFSSYFTVAALMLAGHDFVARLHHARNQQGDLCKSRRLGPGEYLVTWTRPPRPEWMTPEVYEQMPESIHVRYICVAVRQRGCRTRTLTVVTTLLDGDTYPAEDVAALYHRRWMVELQIRSLKVALGLDELRCKSPQMVRIEIWVCLLAYNLIRLKIVQTAVLCGRLPDEISFTAGLQLIATTWMVPFPLSAEQARRLRALHMKHLATCRVGHRPGRVEPRAVKKRPKPYKYLMEPRAQARIKLMDISP